MTKTLLITDSFFISHEHAQTLTDAGYVVRRLNKPAATEDELSAAL